MDSITISHIAPFIVINPVLISSQPIASALVLSSLSLFVLNADSFSPSTVIVIVIDSFIGELVSLSNTQQVISLKLLNTNYLYWQMQMKSYLLGLGVFHFVDGSFPCHSSHIVVVDDSSIQVNPFFLFRRQQYQLIMSALISFISINVLHLVVDCKTLHYVLHALEQVLAFLSNSCIMQFHGAFQDLCQGDDYITIYLQKMKSLFDELAAVDQPILHEDFNLYVFFGL